ncbi:MAG TPA: ABC transporter substrate-binding protein, partial [Candidatus Deferrimicrobiaceae bacterium]
SPLTPSREEDPLKSVTRPRTLIPALLLALLAADAAGGLSGAEERGKRIYMEGTGTGEIIAYLAGAGISAPGKGFPCVNCHLAGGPGQREGGVRSAEITWFHLTKEHSGGRATGRVHPAYDEETVMAAITDGIDPAGNALDTAHPRYRMTRDDLEDLVAYIKVMDREPVPGITDNAVRVGILLPEKGPLAEAGREVQALLSGHFAEVNAGGGLYGRSLALVPVPFDPNGKDGALPAAREAVESGDVFCFLANLGGQADDPAARYLSARKVPVLVPLLSAPESGYAAGGYTFHVFASIRDQGRVMTDFLAERVRKPGNRVGILHAEDGSGRAGAEGAREQIGKHDLVLAAEASFAPGTFSAAGAVARMRDKGVDAILYFGGSREAVSFAREADAREWRPLFVAPAPMVGDALASAPPGFLGSVFVATPFVPPDPSSRRMQEFVRIGERYGVGQRHRTFQFLAYSGAILLEEGLRRSGRGVTREIFVDSIGNVWKLETGVSPPLTYNQNRRAGAVGAAILKVDPESRRLVPAADWREPR